jgi:hypothetical protein
MVISSEFSLWSEQPLGCVGATKMLIALEGAHVFCVSSFSEVEHLRHFQWSEPPENSTSIVAFGDPQSSL